MLCVSLINSKGGSGKTTLGWNVALMLAKTGGRVLLVDTDPQGTLTQFFSAREEKGAMEAATVSLAQLEGRLSREAKVGVHDFVVVDTPGRLAELAPAIRVANAILSPVQPSGADYAAFKRTFDVLARSGAGDRTIAVPNRVKTRAQEEDVARVLAALMSGRGRIAGVLGDWVAFQKETLEGKGVVDVVGQGKETRALETVVAAIREVGNGKA